MSGQRTARRTQPPRYGVAGAAAKVGVAPATLRTWARRYGIGPIGHQVGAHRRYTAGDVDRLAHMAELIAEGVPAAEAARVVRAGAVRERALPRARRVTGAVIVPAHRTVNGAARRLDVTRLDGLIRTALADHGVQVTWDRVVRPTLRSLGARWQNDGECIAAEHLMSSIVVSAFGSVAPLAAAPHAQVLLACAPGERHGLPLEALVAALAERGIAATSLGADTTAGALDAAVRRVSPKASVIYAHSGSVTADVSSELLPQSGVPIAAGPGWQGVALPDAALHAESLTDAVAIIEAAVR